MPELTSGSSNTVSFIVPAMSVDVMEKNALGKKVKKLDSMGRVISVNKILPKERPRFGRTKTGKTVTFTSKNTSDFEAWIRRHFFQAYPGSGGVFWRGAGWPVHDFFLGCAWPEETRPCARFRSCKDFLDCQACSYRRKNLAIKLDVHLKDDRHLDLDNVLKIVLDALNRVFFYDDTQFVHKEVTRVPYSSEGEHLQVSVAVIPVQLHKGSVIGGYQLKELGIDKAKEYVAWLIDTISTKRGLPREEVRKTVIEYARRCDSRKYTETLDIEIK